MHRSRRSLAWYGCRRQYWAYYPKGHHLPVSVRWLIGDVSGEGNGSSGLTEQGIIIKHTGCIVGKQKTRLYASSPVAKYNIKSTCIVGNPVRLNSEQTGIRTSWDWLSVCIDHLLPYHVSGVSVRADPPPPLILASMVTYLFHPYPESLSNGHVINLIGSHSS
jgi:hypothetical protein